MEGAAIKEVEGFVVRGDLVPVFITYVTIFNIPSRIL